MHNGIRTFFVGLVVIFTGSMIGCGGGDGTKHLVIFSQANNAEPYRAAQNAQMERLWGQYDDVELQILDAQQDNQQQIAQIEATIRKGPDLLIVAPNEPRPVTEVMGEAMDAGIPVICLERNITKPNYTTYIRIDNYKIGRMAGEWILDTLRQKYGEPRGKIVELKGLLGIEAEENRRKGAHDVWKEYPEIRVVHGAVANWLQSEARKRMTEILRVQEEIDVVYGHNDPMAVGAYLAAKDLDRAEDIIFVGVDGLGGPAGGIKKVMDGILDVTFHYPLGVKQAVEVGNKIIRNPEFEPEKEYVIPSEIVKKSNARKLYEKYTIRSDS